jgi:hypothetical protein
MKHTDRQTLLHYGSILILKVLRIRKTLGNIKLIRGNGFIKINMHVIWWYHPHHIAWGLILYNKYQQNCLWNSTHLDSLLPCTIASLSFYNILCLYKVLSFTYIKPRSFNLSVIKSIHLPPLSSLPYSLLSVWFKSTTPSFLSPAMFILSGVDHKPLTSCLPPCKQLYGTRAIVTVTLETQLIWMPSTTRVYSRRKTKSATDEEAGVIGTWVPGTSNR